MKYFIDTEFIEKRGSIELISLGMAAEDDRTLYAENAGFDERNANDWVKANVLPNLHYYKRINRKKGYNNCSSTNGRTRVFGNLYLIEKAVREFIKEDPIFWGYYCDYDWVVFCWLFGAMVDLPKGYPMYCRDLKQELDRLGVEHRACPDTHNALNDAVWMHELHKFLETQGGLK